MVPTILALFLACGEEDAPPFAPGDPPAACAHVWDYAQQSPTSYAVIGDGSAIPELVFGTPRGGAWADYNMALLAPGPDVSVFAVLVGEDVSLGDTLSYVSLPGWTEESCASTTCGLRISVPDPWSVCSLVGRPAVLSVEVEVVATGESLRFEQPVAVAVDDTMTCP